MAARLVDRPHAAAQPVSDHERVGRLLEHVPRRHSARRHPGRLRHLLPPAQSLLAEQVGLREAPDLGTVGKDHRRLHPRRRHRHPARRLDGGAPREPLRRGRRAHRLRHRLHRDRERARGEGLVIAARHGHRPAAPGAQALRRDGHDRRNRDPLRARRRRCAHPGRPRARLEDRHRHRSFPGALDGPRHFSLRLYHHRRPSARLLPHGGRRVHVLPRDSRDVRRLGPAPGQVLP